MSLSDARALWTIEDPQTWRVALDLYPGVMAAQGKKGLDELDAWYHVALPQIIGSRQPAFVTVEEFVRVVEWKMCRGEWRPRNLVLIRSNPAEQVRAVSEAAFADVPDPRKPVAKIAELAGAGPATASAVLAAFRGDLYPFLDDVVGAAIPDIGEPQFTLPYYVRYAAALSQRADRLGEPWTAQAVGLALWSASGGKTG